MRKTIPFLLVLTLFLLIPSPVLAAGGNILSLTASGGSTPNSTITVKSSVQATKRINSSNLYYTITGPDSNTTIRATHRTRLGRLNNTQTYSDSWTTTNNGWPIGNYTLRLCWSSGYTSSSCDIASATTTFYSVPTLGWTLTIVALSLFLGWLWRRRKEFEPVSESAKA